MSVRRRSRAVAYFLSLFVLAAAVWLPTTALAQLVPGAGGGSFSGGALTSPTSVLDGSNFQVLNTADPTKILQVDVSGVTTGNTIIPITFGGTAATPTTTLNGNSTRLLVGNSVSMTSAGDFVVSSTTGIGWAVGNVALGATADTRLKRLSVGVIAQTGATGASIGAMLGGGANVASADPLPVPTGNVFHVTGTTSFTNITTTNMIKGACFTMIFDGILTITDGGNLKLSANYTTSADDTLSVCYDGTNYYEVSRSVN